jgi:hypothetical protein
MANPPPSQDAIDALVGRGEDGILTADDIAAAVSSGIAVNAKASDDVWDGATALHTATGNNHFDTVVLLLNAGADPNVENRHGWTSTYYGAFCGTASVLRELVTRGADTNKKNRYGESPLIRLVRGGRGDVLDRLNVLLSCDALDLDTKFAGKSVEEWAVEEGHGHLAGPLATEVRMVRSLRTLRRDVDE